MKKRFTEEQIVRILREAEARETPIREVCKRHNARLGPYTTYNFSIFHRFNDHLRVGFIANNIFNKMGLEDETHTSWPYFNHFVGQTPSGRELFLQVDYTF